MPYKLNKIIFQRDNIRDYETHTHPLDTKIDFPFVAGKMQELIPKVHQYRKKSQLELSDIPLFNESGLTKLNPEVGPKGIYYLELRPKHKLKQLVVDPNDVVVDIYIGQKDTLIYSFYNPTRRKSIAITAAIEKDDEGVYLKIKANPADIRWRQYFINSISSKYQALDTQTYNFTVRELMTQDQLADYLQVSKKTIQNWTSTGKLKGEWISGTKEVRYRKSTIDDLLKSDSIKSGYHKLKSCHRCFHYLTYLLSLPQQ